MKEWRKQNEKRESNKKRKKQAQSNPNKIGGIKTSRGKEVESKI